MEIKIRKDWKAYCESSFNSLKANLHNWGKPEFYRPITRIYYINVFDSGLCNFTGLISENALQNKLNRIKVVHDHCLSPQFIGRMILDNSDVYLTDYKKFEELFWTSCSTVLVTAEENIALSDLTINDGYTYKVKVPTHLKYNHLGIKLFFRPTKKGKWKNSVPLGSNIIETPQILTEYEKKFLI
jgi:hypothetical protein